MNDQNHMRSGKSIPFQIWDEDTFLKPGKDPVVNALYTLAREGNWEAKKTLQLRGHKRNKFLRRVLNGTRRTPFMDEVLKRIVVARMKG